MSTTKITHARGYVLACSLLAAVNPISAAPAVRDSTSVTTHTIEDFTTAAIANFLAAWHADQLAFNVKNPWSSIDFAGQSGSSLSPDEINNEIFNTCDGQKDRAGNGTMSFSNSYKDFVQDLNQVIPNNTVSAQVNATDNKMMSACYDGGLQDATTKALNIYNSQGSTPTTNKTDPAFLSWAHTADPDYITAYTACQQATLNYYSAVDNSTGDDAGLYAAAREHVEPLLDNDASSPGINMPIASGNGPGVGDGNFAAYYAIPTLNTTLTAWQAGNNLSPVKFSASSNNFSSSQSTSFGGSHLGITYEIFSASASTQHTEAHSSLQISATDYELSFAGLALLDIEQGVWFDNYRVAHAAQNPDSLHKNASSVFSNSKYFGSQDAPGALAVYNTQALVGFQPKWSITLDQSVKNDSSSTSESSFNIGILGLAEIGGYGGSTSNNTKYDNSTNTLTVEDGTNNGYILGFVQTSYYSWS